MTLKVGDRVKIIRQHFGHPDLDPMSGVVGVITEVAEPYVGDPAQRIRYGVGFDKPIGPGGYIDSFPFFPEDLEKNE